jgi:hypothetical protein
MQKFDEKVAQENLQIQHQPIIQVPERRTNHNHSCSERTIKKGCSLIFNGRAAKTVRT